MAYHVVAYNVAKSVAVKSCKNNLKFQLLFSDSDELFYQFKAEKYIYVFQYGMLSFFNMTSEEISEVFKLIKPYAVNFETPEVSEDISITFENEKMAVEFDHIVLPSFDAEMIRLVMLNASQSVALSRYSEITENLLFETNKHTVYLEKKGKLDISGNKLKRFIGKTLNIKNKISENLYIFDSPDVTWENEQLNKLNLGLKQTFDLKDRYRVIHDRVEIIKENLELFKDIMDHKESSKLEWIIIILILVEVVDMFILKML
ncbi:RMD1 family protein [Winogradskyella maritima]|uniref:RMD1 family protein n=1 Tax=Winogradskyella maritima TaxID=1517766 RepID=A0ABV8AFP0_9FLAO|nr:RMD1 family protein [Winogradskyella maritima]